MLKQAIYVTLFVSDQNKALEFYTRVLGFEKRLDNPLPGGDRFLTVGLPGQELEIVLWPGTPGTPKQGPGLVPGVLILATTDARKQLEELKARGMHEHFDTPQVIERPDALLFVIRDLDGNRLVIRENRAVPSAA